MLLVKDHDRKVRVLAMTSLARVFKDLAPGYRVRPLSKAEQEAQLSKDQKRLRNFELGLVACYQQYLRCLVSLTQSNGLLFTALSQ